LTSGLREQNRAVARPRKTAATPKTAARARKRKDEPREPTHEEIARRAYEISQTGNGGSDEENWHRAERELRGEPEGPWAKIGSGDTESVTSA